MPFKPGKVVAALTKVVPDVDAAVLTAVKTELLSMDKLTLLEAHTLLLRCGVSPAHVFDVREELDKPPAADDIRGKPLLLVPAPESEVQRLDRYGDKVGALVLVCVCMCASPRYACVYVHRKRMIAFLHGRLCHAKVHTLMTVAHSGCLAGWIRYVYSY